MTASTLTFTISAFVTFLTIIDPVGLAPVVVALTAHHNDALVSLFSRVSSVFC